MKHSPPVEKKATPSGGWRAWVSWFLLLLFAAEITAAIFVRHKDKTFAVSQFAKLPLIFEGRVQPMDSLARNSLLQIRGITAVPLEGNGANGAWGAWEDLRAQGGELSERRWHQFAKHPRKLKPADWLLEVFCSPRQADDRYIFVINHPDLRSLLKLEGGVENSALHFYRFNDLKDQLGELRDEAERAGKLDASQRNPFDRAVLQLNNAFGLYFRLKNTVQPEDSKDFRQEIDDYLAAAAQARAAVRERQTKGEKLDDDEPGVAWAKCSWKPRAPGCLSRRDCWPGLLPRIARATSPGSTGCSASIARCWRSRGWARTWPKASANRSSTNCSPSSAACMSIWRRSCWSCFIGRT